MKNLEEARNELSELDIDGLRALVAKDVRVWGGWMQTKTTLYTPPGCFVIEQASRWQLMYGLRRSFCVATDGSIRQYNASIQIHEASGKHVQRMQDDEAIERKYKAIQSEPEIIQSADCGEQSREQNAGRREPRT